MLPEKYCAVKKRTPIPATVKIPELHSIDRPAGKGKKEMKGFWALDVGDEKDIVSLYEGMQQISE